MTEADHARLQKFADPIMQPLQNIDYNSSIRRMRSQFERLECKKFDVQLMVDEANRNNEIVGHLISEWMTRVNETETSVKNILEDVERMGKGCFSIWCLNLLPRYELSVKANMITQDIMVLLNEGEFDKVSYPPPPRIELAPPTVVETRVFENQGDGVVDSAYALRQLCRRFTLAEMQLATQNFSNDFFIGKGGFGKVYIGFIDNGETMVAVKRLDPTSSQGDIEFRTEIEMLSRFRHCNLVSLVGYCQDGREMILIYEYLPNGSMADHLHPKDGSTNGSSSTLSWVQRLKICIGAARGIDYLHTGTGVLERVVHRDVKTSNILLDGNWAAKVSDFGLCKLGPANQSQTHISTRVKGTPGYCDPEYFLTHRLTKESDVYAFGVVLFEVLSGKPALDFSLPMEQRSLATWAQHCIQESTTHRLIDPNLKWEISSNSLKAFVEIAGQCLQNNSKKRPKMVEVVASLELALTLQRSKDSALLYNDIFDFGGTSNINDQGLQNQGGGVDKEWLKIDDDEGGKNVEAETNGNDDGGTGTKNITGNRLCKNCGTVESCMLLLPCRHLCVCTTCNFSLQVCPICNSIKNTSVRIMYS